MKVSVRYFASIREAIGQGQETVQTEGTTLGALRDQLLARGGPYAEVLARGLAVRMAVQQQMCTEDCVLTDGVEVAFFPPVTGG